MLRENLALEIGNLALFSSLFKEGAVIYLSLMSPCFKSAVASLKYCHNSQRMNNLGLESRR